MQPKAEGIAGFDLAIGARIRARRRELGLSQADLARHIGVSFQQVQKYERGANRVAGSTLMTIANALKTTVGWMVGEDGAGPQHDGLVEALATPGALQLVEAYAAIRDERSRMAILALVEEISADPARGDLTER
jgi:transcriptional regulator with XRE-family HTH domain